MKLHHAAALALVGWYLMTPPWGFRTDPRLGVPMWDVDTHAPISKWEIVDAYDSVERCKDALNWLGERARRRWIEQEKKLSDEQLDKIQGSNTPLQDSSLSDARLELRLFSEYDAGKCIATDDPRLKGN